jgi:hypothetical protein
MKKVFETDDFAVFDDVLDQETFILAWRYFQTEDFRFVSSPKWVKINRLMDGNPLLAPAYLSDPVIGDSITKVYPTSTGIDLIINKIKESESFIAPWVGKRGVDWSAFFARPYLYPQGTGLAWHDDYSDASGAYIFYLHPEWNASWGGELLIADASTKDLPRPKVRLYGEKEPRTIGNHLDQKGYSEKLLEIGVGHFIQPKPNRLVVLRAGVQHMIKKVDPAAGDHCRCSIAGFFLNIGKEDRR